VSVLLGAFKLVMTLIAVATVDKLGRRPLLLGGVGGMVVALLLLTAAQGGVDVAAAAGAAGGVSAAWVSAMALLLYVGCYQISFGPISWLIVGEVFPLAVSGDQGDVGARGKGERGTGIVDACKTCGGQTAECQQSLDAGTCQGFSCNVQQCPPVLGPMCGGLYICLRQQMLVPAVAPWLCDRISAAAAC
jgi:hypothetical protein